MDARSASRSPMVFVTFEISTLTPLPLGEQVFIAGNLEGLGCWRPDGLPLTRVADDLWLGVVPCDAGEVIEYKVTRGSWDTEEVTPDGVIPQNFTAVAAEGLVVRHTVRNWKDRSALSRPGIVGNYRVHENFRSAYLRCPRPVIVWLPPSYEDAPDRRYPVCYFQDGQQIFDPQTATGGQDWQVDDWAEKMMTQGEICEFIGVAIHSTEDRPLEYHPCMAGPAYEKFLLTELKPWIDCEYRTVPDAGYIAGASLGGTIAFWLFSRHPTIFRGAACLSTAFRLGGDWVNDKIPVPTENSRLFLYNGLGDPTELEIAEGVREMIQRLKAAGWREGQNLLWVTDPEGRHHEASWAKRTPEWLRFLFRT